MNPSPATALIEHVMLIVTVQLVVIIAVARLFGALARRAGFQSPESLCRLCLVLVWESDAPGAGPDWMHLELLAVHGCRKSLRADRYEVLRGLPQGELCVPRAMN